jgi:ankyrin repeat protein
MVRALLSHPEIDVYSRDIHGRTPLIWAIWSGQMENMELLLGKNYQALNIPDNGGRTPLSWAAERGNLTMVKFLLNLAGIDKDKKDNAGRTALSWAVENQSRSSETRNAFSPPQENELIVESLIEMDGIDNNSVDNNGRTPFSWAVTNADLSIVKYLVRTGRVPIDQPDGTGRTPLSWSAEHGRLGVVEALLSKDAVDANLKDFSGRTPLYWAIRKRNVKVMEILIKKDIDTLKMMVLEQTEQPDRVKLLLDAGYDASKLDPNGRTPLHYAVSAKNIESARHLISSGRSSINWKDNSGVTPLSLAVTKSPVLARVLVEHGATTDDIQPSAWFHWNKDSVKDIICLSEQGARQGLQYMAKHSLTEEFTKPLPSEHLRRRLL